MTKTPIGTLLETMLGIDEVSMRARSDKLQIIYKHRLQSINDIQTMNGAQICTIL